MVKRAEKISLWTEGLNRDWVSEPDNRERIPRGDLELNQLKPLIEDIRFKNGGDSDGLLILQEAGERLHISIHDDQILLSDPQNPNYQNVRIREEELAEFIRHYFSLEKANHASEWMHFRLVNFGILAVGLVLLAGAVYYGMRQISFENSFYPKAVVTEVGSEQEFHRLKESYSGIYASGVWEGALVIELTRDLEFNYYDMKRSSPGRFILKPVIWGNYRPVYELGSPVVLANERMILNPVDDGKLKFENREYSLIAKSREEVPHIAFPD